MLTLEEVKAHLRIDHDAEDDLILAYRDAALGAVEDYTGIEFTDPAPHPVRAAVLLLVGDLYAHREARTDLRLRENGAYQALLNPYRDLAVS